MAFKNQLKLALPQDKRQTPYYRESNSDPGEDVCGIHDLGYIKPKVITRFLLGKNPYTQVIVGLNGLQPEILLSRSEKNFSLTSEELETLKSTDETATLSSQTYDGGNLICTFNLNETGGGATFKRLLQPFSCPMNQNDGDMEKFELSRFEVQLLKNHLPNIKTAVENIVAGKTVFDTMYGIIATGLWKTYKSMRTDKPIGKVYHEVIHRFGLCVPAAFIVREYLTNYQELKSQFQLYEVFNVCSKQHVYLKNRLEINDLFCMDWK